MRRWRLIAVLGGGSLVVYLGSLIRMSGFGHILLLTPYVHCLADSNDDRENAMICSQLLKAYVGLARFDHLCLD
jgi:hypothetical protein